MSNGTYLLFVPKQATGADLVYFDLFNATGSLTELEVLSVRPVVSGAVAVSGVVGVDLHLTRTSAIGTGGTAATREGVDKAAATFTAIDNSAALNASITARLTPTGGATAGAVLSWGSVFSEETSAGTYIVADNLAPTPIIVRAGTGLRVIQGAVASVGNVGFNVIFRLTK